MDEGEHLLSQPGNNAGYDTASVAYGAQKGAGTCGSFFEDLRYWFSFEVEPCERIGVFDGDDDGGR